MSEGLQPEDGNLAAGVVRDRGRVCTQVRSPLEQRKRSTQSYQGRRYDHSRQSGAVSVAAGAGRTPAQASRRRAIM